MKAQLSCGVLAVLILSACSSRPDPQLFSQTAAQPGKSAAGGDDNTSNAGSNSVGGDIAAVTNGGGAPLTVGGTGGAGTAGEPGVMNPGSAGSVGNAGSPDGGSPSGAGAPGNAGSPSVAGSQGTAGSVSSDTGGVGQPKPQPPPVCGNGTIEGGEQCDDGGHTGNGCDATCKVVCSQHGQGLVESDDYHCYAGYNQADFAGAQQDCVKLGAHLATITSAAENKVVRPLVSNSKWLGGNEDVPVMSPGTGDYAWLTGEDFDFTNWAAQEPNRAQSHCMGSGALCYEHCVVMLGDGTWADHRCDIVDGYVCEWEPPGTK